MMEHRVPFSLTSFAHVESALRMELVLNLAWVLLAACMFGVWLQHSPRTRGNRRMQLLALAVMLLILFPVISVTDDLQAMQNPAETDSCLRRVHAVSSPHSIFPAVGALPPPALTELSFGVPYVAASGSLPAPAMNHPALAPIQNRPPPLA